MTRDYAIPRAFYDLTMDVDCQPSAGLTSIRSLKRIASVEGIGKWNATIIVANIREYQATHVEPHPYTGLTRLQGFP